MQEKRPIQPKSEPEQNENHRRPCRDQPFVGKLEVKKSDDGAGAEVSKQHVEVEPTVVACRLFTWPQLKVDEEQDQRDGENRVHPRSPEFARIPGSQVSKENPAEGSG